MLYLSACSPDNISSSTNTSLSGTNLFAGLSQQTNSQAQVLPGYIFDFPTDHASHPDFAIEWWYLTANLVDQKGEQYAMQWTLFRFRSQEKMALLGRTHNNLWPMPACTALDIPGSKKGLPVVVVWKRRN